MSSFLTPSSIPACPDGPLNGGYPRYEVRPIDEADYARRMEQWKKEMNARGYTIRD